jgi:protein required for attachment to host cells
MGKHLVLVADSSNARLMEKNGLKLERLGPVYEREEMMTDVDMGANKPGRIKVASSTRTYAPHSDVRRVEKEQFIREIAKVLNADQADVESLVLIAPPQTLGELRKLLDPNVLSKVEHEVAKDLTKLREDKLMSYVEKPYA